MTVALTATSAAAGAAPMRAGTSFAGHCQFDTGAFTYSRPVGFLPTRVNWTLDETGLCWGRLNGLAVVAAPTRIEERLQDDIGGCGPLSDAHGPGALTFPGGGRLSYHVRHGIGIGQPLLAAGDRSGLAIGLAEAFTESSPTALAQCAGSAYTSGSIRYLIQTLGTLRG